jgi:TonB family protein
MFFPPDSAVNKELFVVKELYADGKVHFISSSKNKNRSRNPGYVYSSLQGPYTSYFHNGNIMAVCTYENNKKVGEEKKYYPNGKFCNTKTYVNDTTVLYNNCQDSTGKILSENGNGNWTELSDSYFENNYIEGSIKNKLQDGYWQGRKNDSVKVFSQYENGKLIYSYDMDRSGDKIYTALKMAPEFPGGLPAFYDYLGKNTVYPIKARRNNIQGRIIMTVVVRPNGALTDVKVVRGIGSGCDEEAVRVLKLCPKWKPGYQNGEPVSTVYTIPMQFTLSQ